jgi:hypothetical protein
MVSSYLDADAIADPELAKLWREAKRTMSALETFLDAHTPEAVDAGEPEGVVFVQYTALLCDSVPDIFAEDSGTVLSLDEFGLAGLTSVHSGTVRLNLEGGRFSSDPELYIQGDFDFAELKRWLRELSPHVATHIRQHLSFEVTATGERVTVAFVAGGTDSLISS